MDQEDRIYASKVICIQYFYGNHGNTIDINHGSGSHPNEDIKVFKKYRLSDHILFFNLGVGSRSFIRKYSHICQKFASAI